LSLRRGAGGGASWEAVCVFWLEREEKERERKEEVEFCPLSKRSNFGSTPMKKPTRF